MLGHPLAALALAALAAVQPTATPLGSALAQIGFRTGTIDKLLAAQRPALDLNDEVLARSLTGALNSLQEAGLSSSAARSMLRRTPRAISSLVERSPTPLLEAIGAIGVGEPLGLITAEPSLLALDADRLASSCEYLGTFIGPERVADFVTSQPQSLLWRPDGSTPLGVVLTEYGLTPEAVKAAVKAFPQARAAHRSCRGGLSLHACARARRDHLRVVTPCLPSPQGTSLQSLDALRDRASFLQSELELDSRELARFVRAYPQARLAKYESPTSRTCAWVTLSHPHASPPARCLHCRSTTICAPRSNTSAASA